MRGGGSEQYPTAVIVNNGKGTDVYAADFRFNPGRDWVPAASVSLKVNLKEGVNSIITTALIGLKRKSAAYTSVPLPFLTITAVGYCSLRCV